MRVNVFDLKEAPGSHKRIPVQVAVESVELGGQTVEFDRPFTGQAEIWNTGESILVKAKLSGEAQVPCGRCLGAFSLPLRVSFEEEFIEGMPSESEADEELLEERTVTYYEGDEIDLADSLRENVLLELPMKALCREDCKGLCPTCGADQNQEDCNCQATDVVDTRLDVLKSLLRKPDPNS